jgi:hypothetical protein
VATRIDLNLPPRLLEAARATQAANRRQLLNREQQQRDAREVKRQLRKVEEEQRKATRQRDLWKGAVPEFPLPAGVVGGRRDGVAVAHGFLTEGVVTPREYRVWSGDGSQSVTVPLPEESATGKAPESFVAERYVYGKMIGYTDANGNIGSTSSISVPPDQALPPLVEQTRTFAVTASGTSNLQWLLLPAGRASLVLVLTYQQYSTTQTTLQRLTRTATYDKSKYTITKGIYQTNVGYLVGDVVVTEGGLYEVGSTLAGVAVSSYDYVVLVGFELAIRMTYVDQWLTVSTSSKTAISAAPPLAFYITEKSVRAINAPAAIYQLLANRNRDGAVTSATQGLGATGAGNVRLATPQTIEAVTTDDPQSWSPTWLQFSRSDSNPSQLVARKIRVLDPISHEPLDPTSGTLIPGLTVPLQLPNLANLPPGTSQTLLLAWDWGKPALCRQRLLNLGFSPEDLAP